MAEKPTNQTVQRGGFESGPDAEERVYNAILQAILDHRLAPGTKLVELELSQILKASRGAVRIALLRLKHDLLVELRPNRGAVIANPSIKEARDIFEARRVIEATIVRKVADNKTDKGLDRLRHFLSEEKQAYIQGDLSRAQRLSRMFHIVLAELADNQILNRYLENLICRQPLLVLAHIGSQLQYCGAHEHEHVVEALERGDGDAAVRCMLDHLQTLEDKLSTRPLVASTDLKEALAHIEPVQDRGETGDMSLRRALMS
jgi:DNA-binding GntR family transcriptional regulator